MHRIIDEKGTGKTSKLLLLAKENNAVLVCSNPRAMEYKAKQYGMNDIHMISYGEFLNNYRGSKTQYVIDEIENFLDIVYGANKVIGYTLSVE